jgi:hypothetical protein
LPDIKAFPVLTPIPFTVNVVTISKTMKKDDVEEGERIFPAPPLHCQDVHFRMECDIFIKAKQCNSSSSDRLVAYLGGLGPNLHPQAYEGVRVEPHDKIWLPSSDSHDEKKQKGQWKQEVTLRSSFILSCAPTFQTPLMTVRVCLFSGFKMFTVP